MRKIGEIWGHTRVFFVPKVSRYLAAHHFPIIVIIATIIFGGNIAYTEGVSAENPIQSTNPISLEPVPAAPTQLEPVVQPVTTPAPAPAPAKQKSASRTPSGSTTPTSIPTSTQESVSTSSALTISGIVSQINYQRQINGLCLVSQNSALNSAAQAKAQDMAEKNYFAHVSPDGTNDYYFIDQSGYQWQAVGINLAMGEFTDSKNLVDDWMVNSGHRANILASFGREIGIGISGQYYVMIIANPS